MNDKTKKLATILEGHGFIKTKESSEREDNFYTYRKNYKIPQYLLEIEAETDINELAHCDWDEYGEVEEGEPVSDHDDFIIKIPDDTFELGDLEELEKLIRSVREELTIIDKELKTTEKNMNGDW